MTEVFFTKIKIRSVVIFGLVIASTVFVSAQTKRPTSRPQPSSTPVSSQPPTPIPASDLTVFGIKLGFPLDLPPCKGVVFYDEYEMEKPILLNTFCHQIGPFKSMTDQSSGVYRWVNFPAGESPAIVKGWTLTVTLIDGMVEGVAFPTAGVDADALVLATLKQKYGMPIKLTTSKVQNRMGAVFDSISAVWSFSNLVVAFESVSSTIDKGLVNIDTPKGFAFRHKPASPEKRPL